ncbi:Mitochondrial proton/calcium exchanger protein [Balamuthia mandrillaris]
MQRVSLGSVRPAQRAGSVHRCWGRGGCLLPTTPSSSWSHFHWTYQSSSRYLATLPSTLHTTSSTFDRTEREAKWGCSFPPVATNASFLLPSPSPLFYPNTIAPIARWTLSRSRAFCTAASLQPQQHKEDDSDNDHNTSTDNAEQQQQQGNDAQRRIRRRFYGQMEAEVMKKAIREAVEASAAASKEREKEMKARQKTAAAEASAAAAAKTAAAKKGWLQKSVDVLLFLPRLLIYKEYQQKAAEYMRSLPQTIREGISHYWLGTKLLVLNVRTAMGLAIRLTKGHTLTRRERQQLIRTVADIFRLVPFAFFIIVPFMEFLLPIALKLFPNMLPSTFQDKFQEEEKIKKELSVRLSTAKFLQDTVEELAKKRSSNVPAKEFSEFMKRLRNGENVDQDELIKYAKLFKDDFTLLNLSRPLLVSMCKFLGLKPYGTNAFLRWQISNKLRKLKEDDKLIQEEGLEKLSFEELQQACIARGMPGLGLSKLALRQQMEEWLDMSFNEAIPSAIMILSRALILTSKIPKEDALKETLSTLPDDVVDEAELEMEETGISERALRLAVLKATNEKLRQEEEEAEETNKEIAAQENERWDQDYRTMIAATTGVVPGRVKAKESLKEVIEALSLLSSVNPLKSEREELEHLLQQKLARQREEWMKSMQKEAEESAAAAAETKEEETGEEKEVEGEEEKAKRVSKEEEEYQNRFNQRINSMLEKIAKELAKAEQDMGARMTGLIDADRDGVISTQEIEQACALLRAKPTNQEIRNVLQYLDADKDGIVALEDIDKIRRRLEEIEQERNALAEED